jgi:hypothetical protein
MTWSRCPGSPISKVKREVATRLRVVCTAAARMLTWWSDIARVMSESSRLRSNASTCNCTRKTLAADGSQATVDEPVGLAPQERRRWCSRLAVHRHPVAAGDEADDLVAGHRGAAAGHLDPHVVGADDDDARDRPLRTRPPRARSGRWPRRGPRWCSPRRPGWPRAGRRRAAPRHCESPTAAYRLSMSDSADLRRPRSDSRPTSAGAGGDLACAGTWRSRPCPARSPPHAAPW